MERLRMTTGSYINIYKDGVDIYFIVHEANDVDNDKILEATTYLENLLEHRNLNEVGWNNITTELESIFPYGVHIVKRR